MNAIKNKIIISIAFLFIFFVFSVIVRIPWLNRELTDQDGLTATVLRYWKIWDKNGITKFNFNPITTYQNEADKNIDNTHVEFSLNDKKGNFYYTSYPPFSYVFPYLVLKFLCVPRNILTIRIFSLIFHLISAIFIFLILKILLQKDQYALIGAVIYIFTPITLWYQSFVYMADMLIQPFWIITIYLTIRYFFEKHKSKLLLLLIGIMNFISIYTEWLGVFFAVTVFIYSVFMFRKDKHYLWPASVVTVTSLLAIALILYQYSLIVGFKPLIHSLYDKYIVRSAVGHLDNFSVFRIFIHYGKGFLPQIVLLIILVLIFINKPLDKRKYGKNFINMFTKRERNVLFFALFPVILHHIVFFQFTIVHDFSVLKSAVGISLLIAILFSKTIDFDKFGKIKSSYRFLIYSFLVLLLLSSYVIFVRFYVHYDSLMDYKEFGEVIQNNSTKDEVIFLLNESLSPQMVYYAGRNIVRIDNSDDALSWLKQKNKKKGAIFTIKEYNTYLDSKIQNTEVFQ